MFPRHAATGRVRSGRAAGPLVALLLAIAPAGALAASPASADHPVRPSGDARTVAVPGPPAGKAFVAFGDSYASGPGLDPARDAGCGRSSANWASDVAEAYGLGPEGRGDWADYSCAGATADRDERSAAGGPGGTIVGQVERAARDGAIGPGTVAVTFTAGGNDGWAAKDHGSLYGVLAACVRAGTPCGPSRRVGPVAQLVPETLAGLLPTGLMDLLSSVLAGPDERDRWLAPSDLTAARMADRLTPAVAAIRARAPRATIAVVGYPRVVPPAGSPGCSGPLGLGWDLTGGEVAYVDGLLAAYDRAQRAALAAVDPTGGPVRFVDLRRASAGHDLCAGDEAWVSTPVLRGLGFGGDSLHPSADGMSAIADVVAAFGRATGLGR